MPGTGHLELARAALEVRPEPRPLEIRDLTFLSAFIVEDEATRELRVHLARTGTASQSLVIAGRTEADDGSTVWQEHVTASVGYIDVEAPRVLDVAAISARCKLREERFTGIEESVYMQFGDRWRNLRSIRFGQAEAFATLELSGRFAGDLESFRLHPALMDMATSCGWPLVPGFDAAKDFFVPLSYTRLRMFAPLPRRVRSHVRLVPSDFDPREFAVFDVTITDDVGRVLVDISEFVMKRVTDIGPLQDAKVRAGARHSHARFDPPASAAQPAALARWMEGAIRSDEGMEAIERIVGGPALPEVYATPRPVGTLLAEMRRPQPHAASARAATPAGPAVAVGEVEAVLATHEAVRECAVLQRVNRPGELKLVAYVVFEPGQHATVSDLRRFLKARLPEHLVPSTFVDLDSLPCAADGTVDCPGLPDPFGAADDYVGPRTATEQLIAEIWQDVLGVDRVSVYDNFFDAGGHSLLAVRAVVRIDKKFGVRLSQAVMVLQTLEQIAAECDKRRPALAAAQATPAATDTQPSGSLGLGRKLFNALRGE